MKVVFNNKAFMKEMNNIIEYSYGFIEGMNKAKPMLYRTLGPQITELASQYIDSNARLNPQLLHHIYEWNNVGSPEARLFDIDYKISAIGLTFNSSLKQSKTIKDGSNVPFYNKASIMENGTAVTIRPKKANALRFEVDGDTVYTKSQVVVENPGGETQGQFEKIINEFFGIYFRQSFLRTSGLYNYFNNPRVYKTNIRKGARGGRSAGINVGYNWVAAAGRIR